MRDLRTYGLVSAIALIALATLLISPPTQAAKTIPEKAVSASADRTTEPSAKADKETRESAYEKLRLDNKLVIKRPAPEEPIPAPAPEVPVPEEPAPASIPAPAPIPAPALEPELNQEQEAGAPARAEEAGVPVLPGRFRKARVQEARSPEPPEEEASAPAPPVVAPPAPAPLPKPTDTRLLLTVPRLGLADITVGDSPKQSYLDQEGIMHLSETGFPFKRNSNTYIAGHAGDFGGSRIPNVFRNLNSLRQEDLIALRDANGKVYNYRVYERLVVNPRDVWVTDPIPGKKIVSLQTCFPAPTYEKRLIVRGELVK